MRSASGRVLTCGIDLAAYGFEVRYGYGDDLLFSRRVADLPAALLEADALKATVNDKGTFTELDELTLREDEMLSVIGQPVPELPVADVERSQQHYRDTLGFEVGWLDPSNDIGAVSRGDEPDLFLRKRTPPFEPAVHWVFAEDLDASTLNYRRSVQRLWRL